MENDKSIGVPDWFNDAVISGIQRLAALSLNGTPPAETIGLTAIAWTETLWEANIAWDEQLDERRINAAFKRISREIDRWPAPKHLLDYLPSRPEPKRLPRPEMTDSQKAAVKQNLQHMKAMISKAFTKV